MANFRVSHAAQADIISILAWSNEQFGEEARRRYEALIAASIRDAASRADDAGHTMRPELGDDVFTWHLSQSRTRSRGGSVHRPRHFLVCRRIGHMLVVGRILHDAMDVQRYADQEQPWD